MNISDLTKYFVKDKNGIYIGEDKEEILYPEDGNEECYLIEDKSFWFEHRNKCIEAVIKKYPPVTYVVDVGGGNGYVAKGIIDSGVDAILLEPGYMGALNAKTKRKIPIVINTTFENIISKGDKFDAFGCFDVIEHIDDDKAMIDAMYESLDPGGYIYLTVPAHNWLWSESDDEAKHCRRYNKQMLESLFGDKFEIVYFTYFFNSLLLPILLFRRLPYLIKSRKGSSLLSRSAEHGGSMSKGVKILNWLLGGEFKRISLFKSLSFGTSCLMVVRKPG